MGPENLLFLGNHWWVWYRIPGFHGPVRWLYLDALLVELLLFEMLWPLFVLCRFCCVLWDKLFNSIVRFLSFFLITGLLVPLLLRPDFLLTDLECLEFFLHECCLELITDWNQACSVFADIGKSDCT